jgi:acetyl-CoA carboxylase biotin carboxylase subunit
LFSRILIANRGEIAVRITRTCRRMGIHTVVPYSKADADALFVGFADEAHCIGEPDPADSYLNIEKLIKLAQDTKVDAIHPGYGFLSENPDFAEACETAGIAFIGPNSAAMRRVKPKHKARDLLGKAGIPIAPGFSKSISDPINKIREITVLCKDIGYPIIIKPSNSGGGIGMMVANNESELQDAIRYAGTRGKAAFGFDDIYVEKYITQVKHIEVQMLSDNYGNMVHLGERECSVQRRFQKLIEESPSSAITPETRQKLGDVAKEITRVLKCYNALTVEFIYSIETGDYYFNECNARLQVEHSVTELATNIDLVREQLRIAAGEKLQYKQEDIHMKGHAIECRINAEDPLKNFMPSPQKILKYNPPKGFGIRVDSGAYAGYTMPFYYDPLIAKLMVWGRDRNDTLSRMKKALKDFTIEGVKTNIPFHLIAVEDEHFREGKNTTLFITERELVQKLQESVKNNTALSPGPVVN